MALESKIISISLAQGVDTKTDKKQVVPGKLLQLENGVFTSPGQIQKRNGFRQLTKADAGEALATFNDELLVADGQSLYSYSTSNSALVEKGRLSSCHVSVSPVVRDTYQQTAQDGATHSSGMQLYTWEDSSGGIRYSVIDGTTGQIVVPSTLISATGVKAKTLVFSDFFVIFYYEMSTDRLCASSVPVRNPSLPISPVNVTASGGDSSIDASNPSYDATIVSTMGGDAIFLVYANGTGGFTVKKFPSIDFSASSKTVVVGSQTVSAVNIFGDMLAQGPVICWWNDTDIKFRAYDGDLISLLGSDTLATVDDVSAISGVSLSAVNMSWQVFATLSSASHANDRVIAVPVTGPYDVGSQTLVRRSVGLAGKAFSNGGIAYAPLAHESSLQSTYFVADATGFLVAKVLPGDAGFIPRRDDGLGGPLLPESTAVDATTWRFSVRQKDLLTSIPVVTTIPAVDTNLIYTQTGVSSATVNFFNPMESWLRGELGANLIFNGGFLQAYDGASVTEQGFHLWPELVQDNLLLLSSGGHLGIPGGTAKYWYCVTYEWTDLSGQIHRSAPSIPLSVETASGNTTSQTILIVPTLRLTARMDPRSPVLIQVYRTQANGTVFYSINTAVVPGASESVNRAIINAPAVDSVGVIDRIADDSPTNGRLIGNPQLYTTGGVFENIPPPSVGAMTVHRNRIFAVDSTNPLSVWYSKQVSLGVPVEFTDAQTLNIDPKGGPVTALASLDDKLLIFKKDRIFTITGQGPDATGGQYDFSDALLVTTDVGCTNPRSLAAVPDGVVFQSQKGIHLITRGLQAVYIGAPVERYNADTVTSTQLVATTNQIRFTLDSGVMLVFDYFAQQWGVFTPIAAVDSAIWDTAYVYLRADGTVCLETPGEHADPGNRWIKLRLQTSWLSFDGLQGYQRVRDLYVLGSYVSPHKLQISLAYDFSDIDTQVLTVLPTVPRKFGADITFGASSPFGGSARPYMHRVQPHTQKASAVRVTVEDVPEGPAGQAMSLSAFAFEVGVKPGLARIPNARQQ